MTHRTTALVAACALALVTACSAASSGPADGSRPAPASSAPSSSGPAAADVWGLRDEMSVEEFRSVLLSQQATEPAHVTAEGTVADRQVSVSGDTSPGEGSLALQGTAEDGRRFVIVGGERYFSGKPLAQGVWAHLDAADTSEASTTLNDWLIGHAVLMDPSRLIGEPANAAVRRVGPATLGSEQVTQYRADTDGGPTTVYVDARNRVRRVVVDRTTDGVPTTLRVDVTRWGQPVDIAAPQASVEWSAAGG